MTMGDILQRGLTLLQTFPLDMALSEGAAPVPVNIILFLSHRWQQGWEGEAIPC